MTNSTPQKNNNETTAPQKKDEQSKNPAGNSTPTTEKTGSDKR